MFKALQIFPMKQIIIKFLLFLSQSFWQNEKKYIFFNTILILL